MASPRGRKRKASVVLPGEGTPAPKPQDPAKGRYHNERFEDGSLRPVRNSSRDEAGRDQALADFFGVRPVLSLKANVRTMDSLLAEITTDLHLAEADFAPEILASAWAKAVGPFLSAKSELAGVSNRTATIRTSHPAVHYELNYLKPQILLVLNNVLGEGTVRTVRIVHG